MEHMKTNLLISSDKSPPLKFSICLQIIYGTLISKLRVNLIQLSIVIVYASTLIRYAWEMAHANIYTAAAIKKLAIQSFALRTYTVMRSTSRRLPNEVCNHGPTAWLNNFRQERNGRCWMLDSCPKKSPLELTQKTTTLLRY